ncbi:V-type ATP synthase subunit D [Carnobacteriaceae bacterium zg-ZUI252]|nr:V-type ATP synthase subunit D [Carnobacteriaceae bacterium zg-ZUI252]MBS4770211.1 V-type ATP synthase subunit D [Carnobacteriaceae bacterium zg-ZUI240]QTU83431.1 V-type ATP synthase subunit D [Carnobacteriaceae bacterium zg-C25]
MARLNVKPTRMEMTVLKKRLKTSTRGHKLLKDKQDELMRRFIDLIRENNTLRRRVEERLTLGMQSFVLAKTQLNEVFIEEGLTIPMEKVALQIDEQNIMSVNVPQLTLQTPTQQSKIPYGMLNSTVEMDDAIESIQSVTDDLLALAQIEKTCQLLADEIEKTRRRVNALEHLIIPQLKETIHYIQMKLEENERSNIVRMMKVKDK